MTLRKALAPGLLALGWLPLTLLAAPPSLFDADGYRQLHYRSPTPARVDSATTLDTTALRALLGAQPQAQLIDVYRRAWLHGQFIADQPHHNLPGSHWLANTGEAPLAPRWQRYLAHHLARLSEGDPTRPLVFYCHVDCWLGWNAVRRAHALGYRNLYWYRDGIEGWQDAGLPLHEAEPAPLPPHLHDD